MSLRDALQVIGLLFVIWLLFQGFVGMGPIGWLFFGVLLAIGSFKWIGSRDGRITRRVLLRQ
ncbi:hypothetical protein C484_20747 [Natrialba taiwanensis DSM 12281]|uniref:Uncharacterized protein n=1 Tax=Natrialba taiwanensis DSM 12281 TaxID=1230458 RepID=L9ZJG1_9EURY|nr:hypothetical protein C484_20747 [Natrialba taiwanensis DSM 12281]